MTVNKASREATLWAKQKPAAEAALRFWNAFLGLSRLEGSSQPLNDAELDRLLTIIRAVSWAKSKHGTGPGQRSAADPMQGGHPQDAWWRQLVAPPGTSQDRIITGQGRRNYWAGELADAAAATAGFPVEAALAGLQPSDGHDDPNFTPVTSYFWAVPRLIHKINTGAGAPTSVCGDLGRRRLLDGAMAYDGQSTADDQERLEKIWAVIGGAETMEAGSVRLRAAVTRALGLLNVTNTKLVDVQRALEAIPKTGKDTKFSGVVMDEGGEFTHIQGLAAFSNFYLVTHSDENRESGRILLVDRTPGNQTLVGEFDLPVVSETKPFYFHAGGCQLIGDCLAVPSETRKNISVVAFFDVSDPLNIHEIDPALRIKRGMRDAAAAGITNFTRGGQEVWLTAVFDSGTVDFYESPDLAGAVPFKDSFSCKVVEKHHQALLLLTDTANRVFAVGINKTFIGENTAVLYQVDFVNQELTLLRELAFKSKGGAALRWGATVDIRSDSKLVMHCTSKHYQNGCHINIFDADSPVALRRAAKSAKSRGKRAAGGPRRAPKSKKHRGVKTRRARHR